MPTSILSADRMRFDQHYQSHIKHLRLEGLQPKTIDAHKYQHGTRDPPRWRVFRLSL